MAATWTKAAMLLRKTALIKSKSPMAWICEAFVPVLLCGFLGAIYFLLALDRLPATSYASDLTVIPPLSTATVAWGYDGGYIAVVAATPAAVATAAAFVAHADRLYTGLNLTATPVGPLFPHSLYAPPFAAVRRVFNSSSEFRAATDAEVAATGQVKCRSYVVFDAPSNQSAASYTIGVPSSQLVPPGMPASTVIDLWPTWPAIFHKRHAWATSVASPGLFPGIMALQLAVDRWAVNQSIAQSETALRDDNSTVLLGDYVITAALSLPRGQLAGAWWQLSRSNATAASATAAILRGWLAAEQQLPAASAFASGPAPARQVSDFFLFRGRTVYLIPLILCAGVIVPVFGMVASMLAEKEARIAELLQVVGITRGFGALAWYVVGLAQASVVSLACAAVLHWTAFQRTPLVTLAFLFILFHGASLSLAWAVSTAFQAVRTGAVVSAIMAFAGFAPYFLAEATTSTALWALCACFPATAFSLAIDQLARWESAGVSAPLITAAPAPGTTQPLVACMAALMCTTVAGAAVALVSLQGCPMRMILLARGRADAATGPLDVAVDAHSDAEGPMFQAASASERATWASGRAVTMSHLRKVFPTPTGSFTAVHDLTATLYADEIYVLLGHNGAGKTTALSMLMGATEPTSGAVISGTHTAPRRLRFGVCPQQDILWPQLTATDHMGLFAGLLGLSGSAATRAIQRAASTWGITDSMMKQPAGQLSGGQKRKLCIALACLGEPDVIILDEPTAGMDPETRQATWKTIRRVATGRIVILTTHFMDEADELGDRVGIMTEGRLICSGTPAFLKAALGVGYQLTVIRPTAERDATTVGSPASDVAPLDRIMATVHRHVADASLTSVAAAEIRVRLPLGASASLPALFRDLDALAADGSDMSSYSLSVTNMEDVFLATATATAAASHGPTPVAVQGTHGVLALASAQLDSKLGARSAEVSWITRLAAHARALSTFRALQLRRLWTATACALIAPACVAAAAAGIIAASAQLPLPRSSATDISAAYAGMFSQSLVVDAPRYATSLTAQWGATSVNASWLDSIGDTYGFVAGAAATGSPVVVNISRLSTAMLDGRAAGPATAMMWTYPQALMPPAGGVSVAASSAPVPITMVSLLNASLVYGAPAVANGLASSLVCGGDVSPRCAGIRTRLEVFASAADSASAASAEAAAGAARAADRGLNTALISSFGFAIVPSMIAAVVAKEHSSGLAAQLYMAGMSPLPYVLVTFVAQALISVASSAVQLLVLIVASVPGITDSSSSTAATAGILLAHGAAAAALAVLVATLVRAQAVAQSSMVMATVAAIASAAALFNLTLSPDSCNQGLSMSLGLRVLPQFAATSGLMTLAARTSLQAVLSGLPPPCQSRLTIATPGDIASPICAWLASCMLAFLAIAVAWETARYAGWRRVFAVCCRAETPTTPTMDTAHAVDAAVAAEEQRVSANIMSPHMDALLVQRLRKEFATSTRSCRLGCASRWRARARDESATADSNVRVAVQSVTFGVPHGSVFGFLGTNGAGKTTTLRMIVGEEAPTSGSSHVGGHDVAQHRSTILSHGLLGYCAQVDALADGISVAETLRLVLQLRRPTCLHPAQVVEACLNAFQLEPWRDRLASTLSGGNKRKLSVAMAFIGKPEVAVLDEPSTGMDAAAKRRLWTTVTALAQPDGAGVETPPAVIVTSHAMEEVEALCHRIGIMVTGEMRCLGTIQQLKDAHAHSLTVNIEFTAGTEAHPHEVASAVAAAVPFSTVTDVRPRGGGLRCMLRCAGKPSLADCFTQLANLRAHQPSLGIDTFSVSQVTLEHVFLAAAEGTPQYAPPAATSGPTGAGSTA